MVLPSTINCNYDLTIMGNTPQSVLETIMAAVPLDLSLPRQYGCIPTSDLIIRGDAADSKRAITLGMGQGLAPVTAALPAGGGGRVKTLTLGGVSGYFAAPPIFTFSPPQAAGGRTAAAIPTMGMSQVIISKGGSGYTVAVTATLVGGNLAPGGVPATLGAITRGLGGAITSVAVATLGSGYTTYPQIVFTDSGGGSGADAYGGLQVIAVTLTEKGSGYTAAPTVTTTCLYNASTFEFSGRSPTFENWMTCSLQRALRSPVRAEGVTTS
jgi:hypothetical protein